MAEYIDREAFIESQQHLYCENCARRKDGKGKFVYDIGDAPCRACGIMDVLDAVEDFPAADVRPVEWIPVTERLPECDLGAEVGNIEWISCGMVHAGCFGRGGKYRDAYFRAWTDAGEGMDAKDADYWRAVTLPEPPKEE